MAAFVLILPAPFGKLARGVGTFEKAEVSKTANGDWKTVKTAPSPAQ